mgnify:CR=1 FL=1
MEEYQIGPGTAGLAQRISSRDEIRQKVEEERFYALKPNKVMDCNGHNQY